MYKLNNMNNVGIIQFTIVVKEHCFDIQNPNGTLAHEYLLL